MTTERKHHEKDSKPSLPAQTSIKGISALNFLSGDIKELKFIHLNDLLAIAENINKQAPLDADSIELERNQTMFLKYFANIRIADHLQTEKRVGIRAEFYVIESEMSIKTTRELILNLNAEYQMYLSKLPNVLRDRGELLYYTPEAQQRMKNPSLEYLLKRIVSSRKSKGLPY